MTKPTPEQVEAQVKRCLELRTKIKALYDEYGASGVASISMGDGILVTDSSSSPIDLAGHAKFISSFADKCVDSFTESGMVGVDRFENLATTTMPMSKIYKMLEDLVMKGAPPKRDGGIH